MPETKTMATITIRDVRSISQAEWRSIINWIKKNIKDLEKKDRSKLANTYKMNLIKMVK